MTAALFFALQIRLSLILLESLSSTTEAGYFTAANRFVEAARMFPNALFGALFPALSALALNPAVMAKTFRRAMLGLALFGVIAGVGFTILAGFLLNLVYGAEFAPAVPTLIVLGWSLGLLIVLSLLMFQRGSVYYNAVRRAVGLRTYQDKPDAPLPRPLPMEDVERLLASRRPEELAVVGGLGLGVIIWLMVAKPF